MSTRRAWRGCAVAVLLLGLPRAFVYAAPPAPAELAPSDASVYVGWTGSPQGWEILRLASAAMNAPLVQDEVLGGNDAVSRGFALLDQVTRYNGALAVFGGAGTAGQPMELDYGLVVAAGGESGKLASAMRDYLAALLPELSPEAQVVDGVSFSCLRQPEKERVTLWAAHGDAFVLAGSEAAAKRLVGRLAGARPAIADNPHYRDAMQRIEPAPRGWSLTALVDMKLYVDFVRAIAASGDESPAVDATLAAFGLDKIPYLALHLDEVDYGLRMSSYTPLGGGGLLDRFMRQAPLTDADVAVVPKDAYFAMITNLDLVPAWEAAMTALGDVDPGVRALVEGAVTAAAQPLGFSLTGDLLPALGDTWVLYDAPSHAGLLFSGIVLVADVKDRDRLEGMLARTVELFGQLAEGSPARIELKKGRFGGREVSYVLVGGLPVPIAPAWGFVDGRWIFSLFPQTVALAMEQADPAARKDSLLDSADFKAARPLLPAQAVGMYYADAQAGARTWYGLALLARTMTASLSANTPQPFDLAAVPPFPKSRTAAHRAMVSVNAVTPDGVLGRTVGLSAPATLMAESGLVLPVLATAIAAPSLTQAREAGQRAATHRNLRQVGMGLLTYAAEHDGRFPPTLETLVEAEFVTKDVLRSAQPPGRTFTYIAGQNMGTTDARDVLAYELRLEDFGASVLFADGHVEWLSLPAARGAIRETYRRLGRESEIPAALDE